MKNIIRALLLTGCIAVLPLQSLSAAEREFYGENYWADSQYKPHKQAKRHDRDKAKRHHHNRAKHHQTRHHRHDKHYLRHKHERQHARHHRHHEQRGHHRHGRHDHHRHDYYYDWPLYGIYLNLPAFFYK